MESEKQYVMKRYQLTENVLFGYKSKEEFKSELESLRNTDDEEIKRKIAECNNEYGRTYASRWDLKVVVAIKKNLPFKSPRRWNNESELIRRHREKRDQQE